MKNVCVTLAALVLGFSVATAAESLPDGAKGFAGILGGKVVSKGTDQITVEVTKVVKSWQHSRAEKPEALVGQKVSLTVNPGLYGKKPGYLDLVRAFFVALKVGDTETFDVKAGEDSGLTFLELTGDQKERSTPAATK